MDIYNPQMAFRGLIGVGGPDAVPPGGLRKATGVSRDIYGSLKVRRGLFLVQDNSLAYSLYKFAGSIYHGHSDNAGVVFTFRRDGAVIRSGLAGTTLRFVTAPPTSTKQDYLFVCNDANGGGFWKVSSSGSVSNWGIAPPPGAPPHTLTDSGVGTLAAGAYGYVIVFLNSTTGTRSNSGPAVFKTVGANRQITVTSIPISADAQVNAREIYRTTAGGSLMFLVNTLNDNVTTSWIDTGANALGMQLQLDNTPPTNVKDAVFFGGRLWFISNAFGETSNIYFSPLGRAEVVESFITLDRTEESTVRLVVWNGLWIITDATIYQIVSTTSKPLTTRRAVGTVFPNTVVATPRGVIYGGWDRTLRLFNGVDSVSLATETLGLDVIAGGFNTPDIGLGDLIAGILGGSSAIYAQDEYLITTGRGQGNTETTGDLLAMNIHTQTWRHLGVYCSCLGLVPEEETGTGILIGTRLAGVGRIVLLEYLTSSSENFSEGGTQIATPFNIQFSTITLDSSGESLIQFIFIDCDTANRTFTPVLTIDETTTVTLAGFSNTTRSVIEIPVNLKARQVSLRLEGSTMIGFVQEYATFFRVSLDVYTPGVPPMLGPAS